MAVILDTNALSAVLIGDRGVERVLAQRGPFAVPVIVLGEYCYGLRSSNRAEMIREALERLVDRIEVLPVDQRTARHYADIRQTLRDSGTPIPENDVWIAAVARRHAMTILSRDTHFDVVPGLERLEW